MVFEKVIYGSGQPKPSACVAHSPRVKLCEDMQVG